MSKPQILRRVASPDGDIVPTEDMLDAHLEGCPAKTSYRTYFQALEEIVMHHAAELLGGQKPVRVVLRAEKHGAFAHPASLELFDGQGQRVKRVAIVATTIPTVEALEYEYTLLQSLHDKRTTHYLPTPFVFERGRDFGCMIAEWFEDFHEFHVTADGRVLLWDYDRGPRTLAQAQVFELFRSVSRILTHYYDGEIHAQIYPWRHAAGDFIACVASPASSGAPSVDVRLTTARGYGPRIDPQLALTNPSLPLLLFFLDLTVRGRLDRVDGTGAIVWLGATCLQGLVRGFLDGLPSLAAGLFEQRDFLELLAALDPDELGACLAPVLETLHGEDRVVAEANIEQHVAELYTLLQAAS